MSVAACWSAYVSFVNWVKAYETLRLTHHVGRYLSMMQKVIIIIRKVFFSGIFTETPAHTVSPANRQQ